MAEIDVSFALEQLVSLKSEEGNLLRSEFEFIKDALKSIMPFLKDADERATDETDVTVWAKQLREACFRIQDVIDQYADVLRHAALLPMITRQLKTMKTRHQIESKIKEIKSTLNQIKQKSDTFAFRPTNEQGSSSRQNNPYVENYNNRLMVPAFVEEDQVVGFEGPKRQLSDWLLGGEPGRTAISVVGMGGLGKTTLAMNLFRSKEIIEHFDCRIWLTVSQSYTIEGLLREMKVQLCSARRESLPEGLSVMDKTTLVTEIRNYLQRNRYVIFFDDVWETKFFGEIEAAMPDNNKRSRIVITTRKMDVALCTKRYSLCHVYEQRFLSLNSAWELFCKKAFRNEFGGRCPEELVEISHDVVRSCEGLPLAIVAVGGLLSTKRKEKYEWQKLFKNLSLELESNLDLNIVTRILALSYDDLPYYLKSCFLYFGIYPEDYAISCARLTRQWIAEGFVKYVEGTSLEDVAKGFLNELVNRSLVQVSLTHLDGTPKSCRIHDMLREMIIRKMKDLSFCHFVSEDEDNPLSLNQVTRRLSIASSSDHVLMSYGHPHVRSIYIFNEGKLQEPFLSTLPSKFRLLKVLDLENTSLKKVPDKLGSLFNMRYLSLRNTNVKGLPKSIGKLLNLETLDLRKTLVDEMPSEIKKLTKLRLLLVYHQNYNTESSLTRESGVKIKEGIACLTSLQKLYHVRANHGGIELIQELSKLRQLRKLGLKEVRREYGLTLSASIEEMSHLESLDISAISRDEIIDLLYISSPPNLRRLCLRGRLERLPDWVPKLQCLVKLTMAFSKLKDDSLKSLKNLPNLLDLSICSNAYNGEVLHFQEGDFMKLKNLFLERLDRLNSILIEKGAFPVLEKFEIWSLPKLKEVPRGIHYLDSLQVLDFADLPFEFNQSIDPDDGEAYWIIKHVPVVYIRYKVEPRRGIVAFDTRTIKHSRPS